MGRNKGIRSSHFVFLSETSFLYIPFRGLRVARRRKEYDDPRDLVGHERDSVIRLLWHPRRVL